VTARVLLFASFVGCVALANVTTSHWGLVPAGLGPLVLAVPFGTYFAGLTFGIRDGLQDCGGMKWTLPAIAAGAVLSFALADFQVALASCVAFVVAELVDLFVYTPLRDWGWRRAVVVSNAVGAVVDTLLFLWLAGFLDGLGAKAAASAIGGQLLVKAVLTTAAYVAAREAWLRWRGRRSAVLGQRLQPQGA